MAIGADLGNVYADVQPSGVVGKLPGARTEAVPGPDGYSGCGLEKPSWTQPELKERGLFPISDGKWAVVSSTKPLTDQDKIDIAINLLERVVL